MHKSASERFSSTFNIRTCEVRRVLREIEYYCNCSMATAFTTERIEKVMPCNVDEYFGCARGVVEKTLGEGAGRDCLPPCESVEYVAWQ
ncbi:hypothetical protein ANCDUO_07398, partial [Ancylostoma duodenale]